MYYLNTFKNYRKLFGKKAILYALKSKFDSSPYEVKVKLDGIRSPFYIRLNTSDIAAVQQVFLNDEYLFEMSKNPECIIDAGANIGLTSLYFANKYPDARILAIEPETSNFEMLLKNTSTYKNITAIQGALWDKNEKIELVDPGLDKWGFQTRKLETEIHNTFEIVQGQTVDDFMKILDINFVDILKIDIEGSEKEVFENSTRWIESVGILIVELHDGEKIGCSRSFYNATNTFQQEWRNGENIYLANTKYVDAGPQLSQV